MCFSLQGPLPLDTTLLGERAIKCRAFAKALHYKEEEFHLGPNTQILESLIRFGNNNIYFFYSTIPTLSLLWRGTV